MDSQASRRVDNGQKMSLHTYLHDHTSGAENVVQMLRALEDVGGNTSEVVLAGDLLREVEEDLAALKTLTLGLGAGSSHTKEAAGWLLDKLSRLKLSPLDKPFHTFEALEFVSLGILGKRALWRALASVASTNPKLQATNFTHLLKRADAQYEAVEAMRLKLAELAFAQSPDGIDISKP